MKTFVYAGLALGLLVSTSAVAQTYSHADTGAAAQSMDASSHQDGMPHDMGRMRAPAMGAGHGAHLSPGDRVPEEYQQDRYAVSDWQARHLASPPSGYRWVRNDANNQYMLASVTTWLIADTADQMAEPAPAMHAGERGGMGMGGSVGDRHGDDQADHSHWARGDRAPDQYRRDTYVVSDWQQRNLQTPRRGYAWVRNDNGQYAMADQRTGRIADVVDQDRYRPDYNWSRGDQLSGGYLDARFTVRNWRAAGLPRPTRGYHWVSINGHYMLTSLRSGMISEIRAMNR